MSPVRSPGYGTSTSAGDGAKRLKLVHSRYRDLAVCYPSLHRNSTQHTVRSVAPNSCSLPHLTTGLEHLQHRSTPDPTWAEPCLPRCWQAGHSLDRLPQPSPDPPDPGLPIAVRFLVPSSPSPPTRILVGPVGTASTTHISTAQHSIAQHITA